MVVVCDLQALGGSGVFSWASADSSISSVNEASGLVKSGDLGQTLVTVTDKRNKKHSAQAQVRQLSFNQLHLNVM